ncbi:hypothetical protein [Dokdonella fugitiva]|uniref:Uncharacterized protein n=1 Tax=Dokdonella fugitiva TaxID=328517 RepID=A0A4R2I0X2_9GAMM|nr:hypothetical protein [Dokdonella fugitiva]MBA8884524.1 hypothetical protein [Dokdonella fugitiva]TCO37286.1 hypothetical protein EV148_11097 [Dokdonella fugitiva]
MSNSRTIAVVGVSEQEVAHLRLLLRKCADDIGQTWRWGDEDTADLVVVDVDSFGGQMARTRAQGAGIRCAVFTDRTVEGADLVLRRPLTRANVIEVLKQAATPVVARADIGAHTDDFYTRDLGDAASDSAPVAEPDVLPAMGLDQALQPQPLELREMVGRDPPPPRAAPAEPARKYATRESMLTDTAPRELREYLESNLLTMPARFSLAGAPPLVLDPKNKVAHAPAALGALEPYCRVKWRLCDWQPLTGTELADVRAEQQSHAYSRLVWLQVLVQSDGHLAKHLDPGGTYKIKHWIEIDKDLGRYFRIASAMLQPARLHEIAAAAAAPMAEVFNLVNAYDAIGNIEWQPRARRHEPATPEPSLMGRIRKPWRRSYR